MGIVTATVRPAIADHDAMVAAIVATYRDASPEDIAAGVAWYPTAGRMVAAIADSAPIAGHGTVPQHRVAFALAALSPRNPWRWNVADAYAFTHAAAAVLSGEPDNGPPAATTFGSNRAAAWRALGIMGATMGDPWASAAPKVRAFVSAILGDAHAVVVDVWAIRVATGGALDAVRPGEYGRVAAAYQDAAAIVGIAPRDVQAITWLVAQRAGLGSNRRSDHTLAFKRGTPAIVRSWFDQDGGAS